MPFPDLLLVTDVLAGGSATLPYAAENTGVPDNGPNTFGLPFVAAGVPPEQIDPSRIKVYVEPDPGRAAGVPLLPGVTDARFVSLSPDKLSITIEFAQSGVGNARVTVEVNHTIPGVGSSGTPLILISSEVGGGGGGPTFLTKTFTNPALVVGDVVYQTGVGDQVDRADASAAATGLPLGVVSAVTAPAPAGACEVLQFGELGGYLGLTVGARYVLGTAPGSIVGEADTGNLIYPDVTPGSGNVLAPVGTAVNATTLAVNAGAGVVGVF